MTFKELWSLLNTQLDLQQGYSLMSIIMLIFAISIMTWSFVENKKKKQSNQKS